MDPKLNLNGNESLDEIRLLMKQLSLVEARLNPDAIHTGTGLSDDTSMSLGVSNGGPCLLPDALLDDDELLTQDVWSAAEEEMGRLGMPNSISSNELYPSDFNITLTDPDLLAVRYNLLNYVKKVINEEALAQFVVPGEPPSARHSYHNTAAHHALTKPKRKDSYTIVTHNADSHGTEASSMDMTTTRLSSYVPKTMSTPLATKANGLLDKTYSTNTYSKKSSPFITPATKVHPSIPFCRNGNTSEGAAELPPSEVNSNSTGGDDSRSRTLTRPSRVHEGNRINGDGLKGVSERTQIQNIQPQAPPVRSNTLSLEQVQSLARSQHESLLSSSPGVYTHRSYHHDASQTSSMEEDDYSGSTGNSASAWSNDTYSLGVSNPPSGTSSGVSSPPAPGSCENVQLASLRRSMPNLAHKGLSLAPVNGGRLQKDAHYNSDLKLSENVTRTPHPVTTDIMGTTFTLDSGRNEFKHPGHAIHMEPLKQALKRADTYLQAEGNPEVGRNMNNGYATYQVRKPSMLRAPLPISRIPGPRNSSGFTSPDPQSSLSSRDNSTTPVNVRGGAVGHTSHRSGTTFRHVGGPK